MAHTCNPSTLGGWGQVDNLGGRGCSEPRSRHCTLSSLGDRVRLCLGEKKKKRKILFWFPVHLYVEWASFEFLPDSNLPCLTPKLSPSWDYNDILASDWSLFSDHFVSTLIQWLTPVIPVLWEAKVGGSSEVRGLGPAWPRWRNAISPKDTKKLVRCGGVSL